MTITRNEQCEWRIHYVIGIIGIGENGTTKYLERLTTHLDEVEIAAFEAGKQLASGTQWRYNTAPMEIQVSAQLLILFLQASLLLGYFQLCLAIN